MSSVTRVPETARRGQEPERPDATDAWSTLRSYGVWPLVRDSYDRFNAGDGFSLARGLAVQLTLALLPFAIALVGLARLLGSGAASEVLLRTLVSLEPGGGGKQVVEQSLQHAQHQSGAAGFLALAGGLVAAVFSTTTAMGEVERGCNRVYGIQQDRPTRRKYGQALLLAVTVAPLGLLSFVLLVAGRPLGDALQKAGVWGGSAGTVWAVVRWPAGIALAVACFTTLLRRSPRRRQPSLSWLALGAGVTVVLWLAFSVGLGAYATISGSFGRTYGALAGVVVLVFWAVLTSDALLLGAATSAQLEAARAGIGGAKLPDMEGVEDEVEALPEPADYGAEAPPYAVPATRAT